VSPSKQNAGVAPQSKAAIRRLCGKSAPGSMSPCTADIDSLQWDHFQPDIVQPSIGNSPAVPMDNAAGTVGKRKSLRRIEIISSFIYSLFFHGDQLSWLWSQFTILA
jgi:hypothetical protein